MKRYYRINQYITAEEVRVIDDKGEQLGVMPVAEALFRARKTGLDLVEVAGQAKPPVVKIIDFRKFRYQEDKKQKAGTKNVKQAETKEIRFTPFIAAGDYETRMRKAKEFLENGDKVRLTVRFVGRQITRKEFGYQVLKKANSQLTDISKVEVEPKWQGKLLSMVLKPAKK